mgnify:CR=1 FL=1|jgi:hypothetical protein
MPGELTQTQLSTTPSGTNFQGLCGHIRFTGATLNNEYVTIGGTPYETDTPDGLAQPGAVAVAVAAGAATAATALAAAINGDGGRPCEAVVPATATDMVLLVGSSGFTIDAANQPNAVASDANAAGQDMQGPDNANGNGIVYESRTILAEDITALDNGVFDGSIAIAATQSSNRPSTLSAMLTIDASGVTTDLSGMTGTTLTWIQANGANWVLVYDEGGTNSLTAGDEIAVIWIDN